MPINLSATNGKDLGKSLKKNPKTPKDIDPLLTGKPSSAVGWFRSQITDLEKLFSESKKKASDFIDDFGDGSVYHVNLKIDVEGVHARPISLLPEVFGHDTLLLKQNVTSTYANASVDVYFAGFNKITMSSGKHKLKMILPILYLKVKNLGNNSVDINDQIVDMRYLSQQGYGDLLDLTEKNYSQFDIAFISLFLPQISMQEFYDKIMDVYFKSDLNRKLPDAPEIVANNTSNSLSDKQQLAFYQMVKDLFPSIKLSDVTLSKYVQSLYDHAIDPSAMRQQLLHYPELSFSSLSKDFAQKASAFPLL